MPLAKPLDCPDRKCQKLTCLVIPSGSRRGPCQLEVALVSPIYHLTSSNYGYNMLQLPQSQGFPRYLFLFAATYLFGGPTQGRDTMTAQFPRVTIMIPIVFSGWGHIPILDTPKFHSVSFHIPIIWLVYTPLC